MKRLWTWLRNAVQREPKITRRYRLELPDRSGIEIVLSNRRPRYTASFTEQLQSFLEPEYLQFRSECIADFGRYAQLNLTVRELENEQILIVPRSPRKEDVWGDA